MGIKTVAHKALNSIVKKYGYRVVQMNSPENTADVTRRISLLISPQHIPFSEKAYRKSSILEEGYTLAWILPPLGEGSGGHLDIFRAIHHLELNGIHSRVYIYGDQTPEESVALSEKVKRYYGYDISDDAIFGSVREIEYADGCVATSWETAYFVRANDNCISKFYFVQDFEPFFYPHGSNYALAENTYHFGFKGITAGNWLANKLHEEFGMDTYPFRFSFERELYQPKEKKDEQNRIFFYARPYTERRAFELGLLAFEKLKEKGVDFEVILAGQPLTEFDLKFNYVDKGVMQLDQLCDVYSQCDFCLVFSMTNLSLLPFEIMASGSVVMSNYGENNEWLLTEENSILVQADPDEIANRMAEILQNKDQLKALRDNGIRTVNQITWDKEFENVAQYVKESITKDRLSIQ